MMTTTAIEIPKRQWSALGNQWKTLADDFSRFGRTSLLYLMGLSLYLGVALNANAQALLGVKVQPTTDDGVQVALRFDSNTPEPRVFAVNQPNQLIIDLPGVVNQTGATSSPVGLSALTKIEIAEGKLSNGQSRTRVVLSLNRAMQHRLSSTSDTLVVQLAELGTVIGAARDPREARPSAPPTSQADQISDISFERGKAGEGRIQVSLGNPSAEVDVTQDAKNILQIDFYGLHLPEDLERRLDVIDFGTPVRFIDAINTESGARIRVDAGDSYSQLAYQSGNLYTIEVGKSDQVQVLDSGVEQVFSGEKLSLNIQDGEIRSVLNIIAEFTGLNIVVRDTVSGSVTLRLNDVPWDQAMDIILQSQNLAMRRNGNVILVAPAQELAAQDQLALQSQSQLDSLESIQSRVVPINYADATEMAAVLGGGAGGGSGGGSGGAAATGTAGAAGAAGAGSSGGAGQSLLSGRGRIIVDTRSNALVIYDTPSRLSRIVELVELLDKPTKQVLIQAKVMTVDSSSFEGIGAAVGFSSTTPFAEANDLGFIGGPTAGGASGSVLSGNAPLFNDFSSLGAVGGAGPALAVVLGGAATNLLSAQLRALEQDSLAKTVAEPRLVTGNNQTASVTSGVTINVVTVAGNPPVSTLNQIQANLQLTVTPRISPNNNITMQLTIANDNVVAGTQNVNTQNVDTTVRVGNGDTLVIGGVMKESTTGETQKVPLLGDIPVLGNLFKGENESVTRNELVVFVSPKVLSERDRAL